MSEDWEVQKDPLKTVILSPICLHIFQMNARMVLRCRTKVRWYVPKCPEQKDFFFFFLAWQSIGNRKSNFWLLMFVNNGCLVTMRIDHQNVIRKMSFIASFAPSCDDFRGFIYVWKIKKILTSQNLMCGPVIDFKCDGTPIDLACANIPGTTKSKL